MKEHELDQLFKKKLEPLEVLPSRQAWQQLEGQLQKKNNGRRRFFLSGIAAGLLLLLGIWGSLEYGHHFIEEQQMAQEQDKPVDVNPTPVKENTRSSITTSQKQPTAKAETKAKPAEAEPLKERKASAKLVTESKPAGEKSGRQAQSSGQDANKAELAVAPKEEIPLASAKSPLKEVIAATGHQINMEQEISLSEKVVISYKADEKEQKLLTEAPDPGSTARNELRPGKIFGFLKKVKDNSSGGLAELREAKDELLSLNFRANK